jgi:hypothetical protein
MPDEDGPRAAAAEIEILLEEYRTLRAEVNQRLNNGATLVGFGAASAALVVGQHQGAGWPYWAIGIGIVIAAALIRLNNSVLLARLSARISHLEEAINARASIAHGTDNSTPLLGWETEFREDRAQQARGWRRWAAPLDLRLAPARHTPERTNPRPPTTPTTL